MEVTINQKTYEVPETSTVADLLSLAGLMQPGGMAVALNHEVIPHSRWKEVSLQPDDSLLLIRAAQGG